MGVWQRMRRLVHRPDNGALRGYRDQMQHVLERIRLAEMQMAQAGSLEELDLARSALQQGHAEMQHLIRAAKRERGMPLRSIGECEAIHRQLLDSLAGRRAAGTRGGGKGRSRKKSRTSQAS